MNIRTEFVRAAGLCLLMTAMVGCKTRFAADFEADSVGSAPNQNPASPEADEIYVLDFYGIGSAKVTSTAPLAGSKSLRIQGPGGNPAADEYSAKVYMYAEPLEYDTTVYASWVGKVSAGVTAQIVFSNGHFEPLVTIKLQSGRFLVNGVSRGTYTAGQNHTIVINVDRDGSFGASINGSGASGSVSGAATLSPLVSTSLQLSAELLGGSATSYYMLDSVNMSEADPE